MGGRSRSSAMVTVSCRNSWSVNLESYTTLLAEIKNIPPTASVIPQYTEKFWPSELKCLWVLSLLQPYESVHSFDVDCFSLGVSLFENECRLRQEVVNAVETQYGKPFDTFPVSEIEWVFQFISVTKV